MLNTSKPVLVLQESSSTQTSSMPAQNTWSGGSSGNIECTRRRVPLTIRDEHEELHCTSSQLVVVAQLPHCPFLHPLAGTSIQHAPVHGSDCPPGLPAQSIQNPGRPCPASSSSSHPLRGQTGRLLVWPFSGQLLMEAGQENQGSCLDWAAGPGE